MSASLFRKFASALRRDRDLPRSAILKKVVDNLSALVRGRLYLRGCNSVGARARCFGRPDVEALGTIVIGDDFATGGTFGTVQLGAAEHALLSIGNSVTMNYGTTISARTEVRIGDRVKIGPYCVVADSELPLAAEASERDEARAIIIGSDVWLGARVTILPGVRIGDGAVIAAGSVVSGEIPPRSVASGIPARVLRVGHSPASQEQHALRSGSDVAA